MSDERSAATQQLLDTLGIELPDELLELALTHRSYAYEHGGIATNERLEFLGDSILGKAVTVRLFETLPDEPEGVLARRRAALVSTAALAEVARGIGLGPCVRLGRGEELTGGHDKDSILADAVEALIGAYYLHAGSEAANNFVLSLIEPLFDDPERFGAAQDPKTSLQELLASRQLPAPRYVVSSAGPAHDRTFTAELWVGDEAMTSGTGSSKKSAEAAAALAAWQLLTAQADEAAADPDLA